MTLGLTSPKLRCRLGSTAEFLCSLSLGTGPPNGELWADPFEVPVDGSKRAEKGALHLSARSLEQLKVASLQPGGHLQLLLQLQLAAKELGAAGWLTYTMMLHKNFDKAANPSINLFRCCWSR